MGRRKSDTSKPRGKKNRDVAADLTHDNDEALDRITDDGAPEPKADAEVETDESDDDEVD